MEDKSTQLSQHDHDLLIKVSTQLESLTGEVRTYSQTIATQLADHENRIRVVENEQAQSKGGQRNTRWIVVVVGFLITIINCVIGWVTFNK